MLDNLYCYDRPKGIKGIEKVFGKFTYTELSKGAIKPDPTWESENLIVIRGIGGLKLNVQVHRKVSQMLDLAIRHAAEVSKYKIRMIGGYCARHKMNDPKRDLSVHSWGAAIDINWDTNGVGSKATTDMPEEFVKAFENFGWEWGGRWKNKDYMHFQFAEGY